MKMNISKAYFTYTTFKYLTPSPYATIDIQCRVSFLLKRRSNVPKCTLSTHVQSPLKVIGSAASMERSISVSLCIAKARVDSLFNIKRDYQIQYFARALWVL